jgi:hypothetical protein
LERGTGFSVMGNALAGTHARAAQRRRTIKDSKRRRQPNRRPPSALILCTTRNVTETMLLRLPEWFTRGFRLEL